MIEEALKTRAGAVAGLTALVSTRVYAVAAPQRPTLPYVVFEKDDPRSVQGIYVNTGWAYTPITFTAYADTALEAKQVVVQLRAAFARLHATVSGVQIDDVEDLNDGLDGYDHELGCYFESLALEFFHDGAP